MRDNVRAFVEVASQTLPLGGPIFEFGSYLVEDQRGRGDLRQFFPGESFTGCDLRRGPGVDRVEDMSCLSFNDGTANSILCLDTLEHVFDVRKSVDEMIRVLAPGGAMLVAVPMDFRIHEYPDDYWRLTPSCLMRLLEPLAGRLIGYQGLESYPHTVFAIGMKAPIHPAMIRGIGRFIPAYQAWLERQLEEMSLARRWKRLVNLTLRGKGVRQREQETFRSHFVLDVPAELALSPALAMSGAQKPATATRRVGHIPSDRG